MTQYWFEKLVEKYRELDYLKSGTFDQKRLYDNLIDLEFIFSLKEFKPRVVGTIPLGINLENSDVDILIQISKESEIEYILSIIRNNPKFLNISSHRRNDGNNIIRFKDHNYQYELFASCIETEKQYGFVHLVVESFLLLIGGNKSKSEIYHLKKQGFNTEKSFCLYFGFKTSNEYEFLYSLREYSEEKIKNLINVSFA